MKLKRTTAVLTALLALLAVFAAFAQSRRKKEPRRPFVIGEERAKADEAEARRKARGDAGASPLPPGRPDPRPEELGLVRPKPNAYDDALAEVCRRYARADAATRASMRRALSEDDLSVLIGFGSVEAVFALRERSAERIADGLAAVAMIEEERTDPRDALVTLSLLNYSAEKIGADPSKLFRAAAALAEPGTSRLILEFLSRTPGQKDLRAAWGFEEVETEAGVGFVSRGFERYDPTYDFKKIAIDVADLLLADKYLPTSVEVATDLPPVWLETADKSRLGRAMRAVRAGASVSASLKPGAHPQAESQMLTVFVVELADEASAQELLKLSREKKPRDYSMLGVAEGRLFCLLVARSFVDGVESFETGESIRRFSGGLSEILRRRAKS